MNWEGRERPFPVVLKVPAAMPDVRALAALAQEMDPSLGFSTPAGAKREFDELGRWDGDRAQRADVPGRSGARRVRLDPAGDLADADRRQPRQRR